MPYLQTYDYMADYMYAEPTFEWDDTKERANWKKHDVSFGEAQRAFLDPHAVIAEVTSHSAAEPRFYCFGSVEGAVLTVRFHLKRGTHPHIRCRVLAKRKEGA